MSTIQLDELKVSGPWAPAGIFIGEASPRKAPHEDKKTHPHRENDPYKEKRVAKRPLII